MIPVRVQLKNFLCYAETVDGQPIEFDFEGSPLWSISGDNGAGKSAVFDAITYALFGQHRGGAQEDSRLIRKGADRCEISFEFRLDHQLYRVRRTVGRPRGKSRQEPKTWQAAQFDPALDDWRPIKETERAVYLDKWVQQNLGFGYDTFVASVMLRQGESDQLVTAQAKKRFEILSGLLDLEPYKQLETAANNQRREAHTHAETLEKRLATLPVASQEDIKRAEQELQHNEQALDQSQQAVTQAGVLVNEAHRYANLQRELASLQSAMTNVEHLLRDADRIRREHQEWLQLTTALPKLRSSGGDLQKAAQQATQARQTEASAAAIDLEKLQQTVAATSTEEQKTEEQLQILRQQHEELDKAFPLLAALCRCRSELAARARSREESGRLEDWKARVAQLEETLQAQREQKEQAEEKREQARGNVAQARAALQQAQAQLSVREAVQNEAVCSRCGQPISPEHTRRELEEAEQVVRTAQQPLEAAIQNLQEADRRAQEVTSLFDANGRKLPQLHKSLAISESAEKEWQKAQAQLQDAAQAAAQVPLALLSSITDGSLEASSTALQGLGTKLKHLKEQFKRSEEAWKRAGLQSRNAQQTRDQALHERDRLQNEAKRLVENAEALRQHAEERLTDVDPLWRERTLAQDIPFLQALAQRYAQLQGIEQHHADLEKAANEHRQLLTRLEMTHQGIATIRPEHRLPESEALNKAEQAKSQLKDLQQRRDQSLQAVRSLKAKQEERQQLENEAVTALRRRRLYTRLTEFLGRTGLQSYLLDEAVRGIAHLANETLARISGGQLRLHIERSTEEIAIQATDLAFSEEPLDVRFLSGSQKFRVSVALAAGIGQYVGRGVGSVRSLVIDEGFGSLDTQGRQEMIDEVRNLSQLLDRVIIVSHQEDFQDRTLFPTGYVLRKVDQQTQVERFV